MHSQQGQRSRWEIPLYHYANKESHRSSALGADAAVEAYCKRNGIEKEAFTRTESNMMAFVSPSKAIEIYKLFTGSNEDKMSCICKIISKALKP